MPLQVQKKLNSQFRKIDSHTKLSRKLFSANDVDEFLSILYRAGLRYCSIKSLVLCYHSGYFGPVQHVYSSKEVYQRKPRMLWPNTGKGIRIKDPKDKQYLADELGRPVFNILTIPIYTKQFEVGSSVALFIEFPGRNTENIKNFYESLLPVIKSSLDRVLLEEYLRMSSLLWTSTFNGLQEPLAVFEEKGGLSNCNRAFDKVFSANGNGNMLKQQTIQHNQKIYEKHCYTVCINNSKYNICHYSDITQSLFLRNQMIQNARITALEDLGESVAHQLNNPLTGVLSMAQLMLNVEGLKPDIKKDIKAVTSAVVRSQKIIANLLDFANSKSQLHLCNLNRIIKNTLPLLKSITQSCYLDFQSYDKPVFVKAQTCLLQQVLFNLIKNACQAVSSLDPSDAKVNVRVSALKNTAVICVEDSGQGIREADYKNIFKPFFTTKKDRTGTGLGLSVSSDIVKSFKGQLICGRSATLGGACFTIRLPLKNDNELLIESHRDIQK